MPQGSPSPGSFRLTRACWGLLFALVAAGVFWLPYYVPVSGGAASESARVGFNNHVAVASVFIGLALAAILSFFAPLFRQENFEQGATGQIGIRPLLLVCGIHTVVFVLLQWVVAGSPPIGEAWYFLPRLYYMRHGLAPYRGFEFAYGPAMIYTPYWVQRSLGLSPEVAYAWCVWAFGIAGNCILWALVRQARAGRHAKLAAFVALAAWLQVGMGLQYTLLRYLCGFGALLVAGAVTARMRHRWYLLPPVYAGLTLIVLMVSPEIGCAFIPGLLVYLILEFGMCRRLLQTAGVYLVLAASVVRLLPDDVFLVFRGFAAGGNAFPVLPSPSLLLYLGTLLVVVPPLLAAALALLRGKEVSVSRPFGGPLSIAFAVQSICLVPGALGRADPGHVFSYGSGAFLLAILGSWPPGRWRVAYWGAVVGVFQVLSLGTGLYFLLPAYKSAAGQKALSWVADHPASALVNYGRSAAGDARWTSWLARPRRVRSLDLENNYAALASLGPVCTPLGDGPVYSVLARHGILKPEYYYSLINVVTPEQLQRKIADIRSCSYLVLNAEFRADEGQRGHSPIVRDSGTAGFLQLVLCFPWLPPWREPAPPDPNESVFAVIRSEYVPTKLLNERWTLWARRAAI